MSFAAIRSSLSLGICLFLVTGSVVLARAQDAQPAGAGTDKAAATPAADSTSTSKATDQTDPLKRPLDEKKRRENAKKLYKELGDTYKKWLDEDVRWIITDEEKEAFLQLSNDEERDQFIEQFWLRRDPTPDTPENEYKEEHYRRIAYANEHFAAGKPGWMTDRGRIYIMYGPPDEIDSHPSGGTYDRPMEEGGGTTSTYPFEDWRYRYIEGVGQEVIIEFVDTCMCNDYHITIDRSEKDALLMVPGAGLTMYEQMGMANKSDRFNGGIERLGKGPGTDSSSNNEFSRLEQYAALMKPPAVKFKDLEEVVTHNIRYNTMPFDVQIDMVKLTSESILVPITIQIHNKDITFNSKDGVSHGVVNIFGRLTTMTGRIAQTFEDTVDIPVPDDLMAKTLDNSSVYWKAVPLRSGRYKLDLVVKDVNGDRLGTLTKGLVIPEYSDDKLAASTLIVADQMEKVATRSIGAGNFVIGDTKVRPRVADGGGLQPPVFEKSHFQKVNFWLQVYNLGIDDKTKKSSAKFEYQIVNVADASKPVVQLSESTAQMPNPGDQVTLEKSLPITGLAPGTYRITIKVADDVSKQTIAPTAQFIVR